MNLTNERLKEIAESDPRLGLTETEWKSIAAELLRWRNLRDAGDEAVERLRDDAGCEEMYEDRSTALDTLRDIAIARGRTRTDAVHKAAELAKECEAAEEEMLKLRKLFRFWVTEYSRLSPEEVLRRGEYAEEVQEIMELLEN